MNADAVPLLDLFDKKWRLEVPLFQRQYVWSLEQQWEPLWEDVAHKFTSFIEGQSDGPPHFLGAMVLDQKQTPATHVDKRQIIDGQQRLTTFQILLAVMRDFCHAQECKDLEQEFDRYTQNIGMMAEPEIDRFKVWPTRLDRPYFMHVMTLGSPAAVRKAYPLVRRKYQRKDDPRPSIIEAYLYFYKAVQSFFIGTEEEPPLADDRPIEDRIDAAFRAMKSALYVVVIDLGPDDDAQVIFETLNARGAPLLPADLLRNYIFLRAGRSNESQEELYEKYWVGFEDEFWRKEVKQGRWKRPRSDLFMQHFLASRKAVDIPIKHLYVEYKHWIEQARPFTTVEAELSVLQAQGADFRRILEPQKDDPIFDIAVFMERFDVRTPYPLLLHLLAMNLEDETWRTLSTTLESYILRRAVVGWSTKNYNKLFLNLVKHLQQIPGGSVPEMIATSLAISTGESVAWPNDESFAAAWTDKAIYTKLNSARLKHILGRINETYLESKTERLTVDSPLTIEHLMPQNWITNWPLPDGSMGLTWKERWDTPPDDSRAEASRVREHAISQFGNLTILTQELNSSVSNSAWSDKKPGLLKASLLPINQQLHSYSEWDEKAIDSRGRDLLERALDLWPSPRSLRK